MVLFDSKQAFIAKVEHIFSQSDCVSIDENALAKLAGYIPKATDKQSLFTPYFLQEEGEGHEYFKRIFYMTALNVANQCGCIYQGNDGQTKRWEIDGSAAKAVDDKLNQMFEDGDLPTWDNPWIEPIHLDAHMAGVPYADIRKKIFAEFTNEHAKQVISDILDDARVADNKYAFTFKYTEWLAKEFPESFGANIFRKKANLVPITFAAYAEYKGAEVSLDVVVPTDYRIPQTLHVAGVLNFSDELVSGIENGQVYDENSTEVEAIRAACILVVDKLVKLSGLSMLDVDGYLRSVPKLPEMQSLKKMFRDGNNALFTEKTVTCYTMHF